MWWFETTNGVISVMVKMVQRTDSNLSSDYITNFFFFNLYVDNMPQVTLKLKILQEKVFLYRYNVIFSFQVLYQHLYPTCVVTQYLLHRIEVVLRKNYNVRTWLCMSLTCAYASLSLFDIYRPQTKLREGNVFTGMCLFTSGERGRYDWSPVPSWSLVQCPWGG